MQRTVTLINNPLAGRGQGRAMVAPVVAGLHERDLRVEQVCGRDSAESLDLCHAAVAAGTDAVVAMGGDGTVHLALQAVAGLSTPLGIIPVGTGNDFAAALGLPTDTEAAMDVIATGHLRIVDAVRATDDSGGQWWWACVLGAGFDSEVNERANRMRWPRGPRRYDLAIFAELLRLKPRPFVLEVDGRREEVTATFIAVGNAPAYGGGMRIAPDADLTDGLLDVVVVGAVSRIEMIRMKPSVYAGAHIRHPAVTTSRGSVVRLTSAGAVAYADGERLAALPVTSTCIPGALNVLTGSGPP